MDPNDHPICLNYFIVETNPFRLHMGRIVFMLAHPPLTVSDMEFLIRHNHTDSLSEYLVYKVEVDLSENPFTFLQEAEVDALLSKPLSENARLSQYWPRGSDNEIIHAVLKKSSGGTNMSPNGEQNPNNSSVNDDEAAQSNAGEGSSDRDGFGSSCMPGSKESQGDPQLRTHSSRLVDVTGTPIGLYHPVFDSFKHCADSPFLDVTPQQLSDTLRLIAVSQDSYDQLEDRTQALLPILDSLLGCSIVIHKEHSAESDGAVYSFNGGYRMIVQVRDGFGTGESDPSILAAGAYAKYWAQDRLQGLQKQCCCPTFILAISGPLVCVFGGITLEHWAIKLLTTFLLDNNSLSQSHVGSIARKFASLALSLSELGEYYHGFTTDAALPNPWRFYPYIRHFMHNGKRVEIQYKSQVPHRAVFEAVACPEVDDRYLIVVKFAESYHTGAHRMLAAKGLAPELMYISSEDPEEPRFAERIMVVMRRVQSRDLTTVSSVPQHVLDDVSSALKILHESNLVFGDLRRPNVLAVEDQRGFITGGMLIDFDWCGTAGQAKYPWNINRKIQWPEGVVPGGIISKAHDLALLEELSRLVESP